MPYVPPSAKAPDASSPKRRLVRRVIEEYEIEEA
jgi:hypothetical protein